MRLQPILIACLALIASNSSSAQTVTTLENLAKVPDSATAIIITNPGKEGIFYLVDSQTPDEAGTIITTGAGKKYKRLISGPINATWWFDGNPANNAEGFDDALKYAQPMQEVIIPPGTYSFDRPISIPEDKKINLNVQGTLAFPGTGGLIVRGSGHKIYIAKMYGNADGDYKNTSGSGLVLEDATNVNVHVGTIWGFAEGIKLTATGTNGDTRRGTQYNRVSFDELKRNNVGILLTTGAVDSNYRPTGKKPWVNENTIIGGAIYAEVALQTTKSEAQTDPFNNNKFYNIGFEAPVQAAMKLNFTRGNLFIGPRFETKSPINIGPESTGNVMITSEVYTNAIASPGQNTYIFGRILTESATQITSPYSPVAGSTLGATPVLQPLVPNPK